MDNRLSYKLYHVVYVDQAISGVIVDDDDEIADFPSGCVRVFCISEA